MNNIEKKHAGYSETYHNPEAAKQYQQKFNRSWHAKLGAKWEMKLTTKALLRAGALVSEKNGTPLNQLTVLDYPCGAGRLATMLATHTAGYLAGDHSPHMVELATQVLKDAGLGEKLIGTTVGDIKNADLPDQCVDLATCMRLLHHFPEPTDRIQILSELKRLSRHALIVTFHDADTIKQKRYIKKREKLGKPCTRVILTHDQFKEEARQAGWQFVTSWQISSLTSGLCIALLQSP
jgi:ubiquinone/menaquinone biosynthesis C-methylase UbiE